MRSSVASQIEQFNSQRHSRAPSSIEGGGMFEDDPDKMDEDPFFNAEEIAFKVRLQCHKDRKTIVKKLVKTG